MQTVFRSKLGKAVSDSEKLRTNR